MRYTDLARMFSVVPVTSPPLRREARPTVPQPPASGARWGKASRFSWSNKKAAASGGMRAQLQSITINYPEPKPREFMRVVRADLKVNSELVRVEGPSGWVEVDRLTRMAFQYTEFPPKRGIGSLQPSRTTIYDLVFDLHPPPEKEAVVPAEPPP